MTLLALSFFFLFFLLRTLTRRQWAAAGIFILIFVVQNLSLRSDPMIAAPFSCLFHLLTIIALLRFGLVTQAASIFVFFLLIGVPITTDFSAWYAGSMLAACFAVLALAGYAFHTALGGQKVFAGKLLED